VAWTVPLLNGCEFGMYLLEDAVSGQVLLTSHWLEVDYRVSGGHFLSLVISAVPAALLGAAASLAQMGALARLVLRAHGVLIRRDEYAAAWRELREAGVV
jgi:hypothetical protein